MKVLQSTLLGLSLLLGVSDPVNAKQDVDLSPASVARDILRCQGIYQQIKDYSSGKKTEESFNEYLSGFILLGTVSADKAGISPADRGKYVFEGRAQVDKALDVKDYSAEMTRLTQTCADQSNAISKEMKSFKKEKR